MVSASTTDVSAGANGVVVKAEEPGTIHTNGNGARAWAKTCKRCGSRVVMGYYEPECLTCGYADYSHTSSLSSGRQKNVVNSATRFVLRYVGDFPVLSQTLAYVKLVRVRNRAAYAVTCPFCSKDMERSSLSGKRPDVREERYRCTDGHRVSLIPRKSGAMGWK